MPPPPPSVSPQEFEAGLAELKASLTQSIVQTCENKIANCQQQVLTRAKEYMTRAKEDASREAMEKMELIRRTVLNEIQKVEKDAAAGSRSLMMILEPPIKENAAGLETLTKRCTKDFDNIYKLISSCEAVSESIDKHLKHLQSDYDDFKAKYFVRVEKNEERIENNKVFCESLQQQINEDVEHLDNVEKDYVHNKLLVHENLKNHDERIIKIETYHTANIKKLQEEMIVVQADVTCALHLYSRTTEWSIPQISFTNKKIPEYRTFYSPLFSIAGYRNLQLELQLKVLELPNKKKNIPGASAAYVWLWAPAGTSFNFRLGVNRRFKKFEFTPDGPLQHGAMLSTIHHDKFDAPIVISLEILEGQFGFSDSGLCLPCAILESTGPVFPSMINDNEREADRAEKEQLERDSINFTKNIFGETRSSSRLQTPLLPKVEEELIPLSLECIPNMNGPGQNNDLLQSHTASPSKGTPKGSLSDTRPPSRLNEDNILPKVNENTIQSSLEMVPNDPIQNVDASRPETASQYADTPKGLTTQRVSQLNDENIAPDPNRAGRLSVNNSQPLSTDVLKLQADTDEFQQPFLGPIQQQRSVSPAGSENKRKKARSSHVKAPSSYSWDDRPPRQRGLCFASSLNFHNLVDHGLREILQTEMDHIQSRLVRRLEWKIGGNWDIWKSYGLEYCISSVPFAIAGLDGMQVKFYPNGFNEQKYVPGFGALFFLAPPGAQIKGMLSLGPVKKTFSHDFEYEGDAYRRYNFIRHDDLRRAHKDLIFSIDITEAKQTLEKKTRSGNLKILRATENESLTEVLKLKSKWKNKDGKMQMIGMNHSFEKLEESTEGKNEKNKIK